MNGNEQTHARKHTYIHTQFFTKIDSILEKNNSTYHTKRHLFVIRHCYLHSHYQNHKYSSLEYTFHYYIEIRKDRMIFFLKVNEKLTDIKKRDF